MTSTAPETEQLGRQEMCPDDLLAGQIAAYQRDIEKLVARKAAFVTVPCPACGMDKSRAKFEKFDLSFVSCDHCDTIYMSPRPTPEIMGDYYRNSENYKWWAEHIFPRTEASRRKKIHEPWHDRIMELASSHGVSPDHLVEVGPGFGTFGAVVKERGIVKNYTGIEANPEMAAASASRGLDIIASPVEDVDAERFDQAADLVVSFEVIEHLFAPEGFIRMAARLLRPGGLLVLTCPNGLGFDIATLGPLTDAVDTEHVNLFNPHSLPFLLDRLGLVTEQVLTPGRLDAEIVRDAVLAGDYTLQDQAFLQQVLIDDWDKLGPGFQQYLAENNLSSHMWVVARKPENSGAEG